MPEHPTLNDRVRLDGKFFRAGADLFHVRGVTYGTFQPNSAGEPFPERPRAAADLDLISELGANTVRVYDIPPHWLLDEAARRGLRVFVTLPWPVHTCFLDSRTSRREVRTAVLSGVQSVAAHPAVFAFAIGNEIPPDIIRWSGTRKVEAFLDELVEAARHAAPDALFTYANFPPTEFLQPRLLDFVTFNVFLHSRSAFTKYMARLHLLAEGKPLLLGECGVDSLRESPEVQAEILGWTVDGARRAGLAGAVVFSFTDEWFRNGTHVTDWRLGLTTAERQPKPAFRAVQACFKSEPPRPGRIPAVSVVIACYNAADTLRECLDSVLKLRHPNYEVIVVDDGSTDETPEILAEYPGVRALRTRENQGLSNARNLGIRAATGEIVAFTDADCRVDPEWLNFLVAGLFEAPVAGIGGPNLLPDDDPPVAAVVMVAPGGPAHVMLDDRFAEHVPGCNMAFWKWALEAIGLFDPIFRQAGDDVDVCWRIQRRRWRLGFAPAAFVWHRRRPSVAAYLRQQAGYGRAEALLMDKHPVHFNRLGAARWQGRICSPVSAHVPWNRPAIYHGSFATGMFQTLYAPGSDTFLPLVTSIEYHALVVAPLLIGCAFTPWLLPPALAAALLPPTLCVITAWRTPLPRGRQRWWSRPLLAWLHWVQPLVRGAARYAERMGSAEGIPETPDESLEAESRRFTGGSVRVRAYWCPDRRERREWVLRLAAAFESRGWPCQPDAGWSEFDLHLRGGRWSRLALITVAEPTGESAQVLRCRLDSRWTFRAHLVFWAVAALLLAITGLFDVDWRGAWVPPAVLGAVALRYRHYTRTLRCRATVVIDAAARDWGLTPISN